MVHYCNGILFGHEHEHIITPHKSMAEYGGNNCKKKKGTKVMNCITQFHKVWAITEQMKAFSNQTKGYLEAR